jgi:hypothetical protein
MPSGTPPRAGCFIVAHAGDKWISEMPFRRDATPTLNDFF